MKNLKFNLKSKSIVQKSTRWLLTLIAILTLGTGQMWGDDKGFYEVYMVYDKNGTEYNYTYNGSNGSMDLGTITSSFKIKKMYLKVWDNWSDQAFDAGQSGLGYKTQSGSDTDYKTNTRSSESDHDYELQHTNMNLTIASSTDPSGSYTFTHWWFADGTWTDTYYLKNGSSNCAFTYKIAPPAVSGFGVTASGYLAGSGTSEDPYLVKSGSSLTLTVAGSQEHTDANSTLKYWLNSGSKQTESTITISNVTATTNQTAVVHAQCINKTTSSLVGTESTSSTIYYKAVDVKDITVYIYVGEQSDAEAQSVEINAYTPCVGDKALAAGTIKTYNYAGADPKFTRVGNWLSYTFEDVTKITLATCARAGANIFTSLTLTDNVYYKYDGTVLDGKCIPAANPTWGTAPASAALGASTMTASVSGAPTGANISWSSNNTSAISVNSSGVITYNAVGNATITASVSWSATGDYCAGSYDLTKEISCTSGATVSVERTCAAYVAAGVAGQVSAHITFTGTSSGWKYRIKQGWSTGYETAWLDASGTSSDWTMTGGMDAVERTYTVELYTTEGAATPVSTANFSVTGETAYSTTIAAGSHGSVSPSTVYANNSHVHPMITATANDHYHFVNWTSNNVAASVAYDDAEETTVTATAAGYTITANFAGDQYSITYKDQGNVAFTGAHGVGYPTQHTYGTETTLVNPTKTGYTFGGWYTNSDCTGDAVTSIGATARTAAFTLYAKWTENITTVGLVANPENAGTFTCGGSAVTSVSAGVDTKPSVTAVPATGYYVKTGSTIWTKGDNNITLSSTTTNSTTVTGVGANGSSSTLTATFSEIYVLRGSTKNSDSNTDGLAGWAATDNSSYVSHSISNGVMTIVANLTSASTDYKFKIYKVQATATYYGQTGSSGYMPDNYEWTLDGSNDVYFTTTIAGNYTFVVDVTGTDPKVKILFPEEQEYSTTVQTDGTPNASVSVSSVNLKPSTGTEISATVPAGYRFAGWTSTGGGISFTNPYSPTTTVTASSEGGTITANFTTDGMIYLKKTGINGPWPGKVWVYFYTGPYWDKDMGSGSINALCREMTRLGQTDIYYYNYGDDDAVTSSYINSGVISFTDQYLDNVDKFYACSAIYRTDFNTCATMFVVENYITDRKNSSAYYNNGYWMKYNSTDPGVTLHVWKKANDQKVDYSLSSVVAGSNEFKVNVTLDGNTEYYFKLSTCNGQWYGNNGTMTTTNSTGWDFLTRNNNNCYITTTAHAGYPFTVTCTDVGVLKVSVEFPLAIGDYRVMYYGKMNSLGGASNVNHPSRFVRGLSAAGTKKDMVSFFAIAGDNEWTLQLQKCSAVSPEVTWDDVGSAITSLRSSVSETGVHNFVVEQSHDGSTNTVNVTYGGKYSGNYYIRTDCAAGGWEAYKETADNQMTYSDVAKESGYDYYYCHWVETPRNIQFTVANDYSEAITENYVRETESEKLHITNYINSDGTLNGRNANVRFMYNSSNNYIGRAYIDGANESDNNFLKLLSSDGKLYSGETGGASLSELKFSDNGNWIYEADVYSLPDAQIKLRSNFGTSPNEVVQWFKGGESETVKLIGGTGTSRYKIRVVYDFKTNRLVSAWLPSGTLTSDQDDIYSDIMFIREHQGDIEQVTFNNHRIDDVQKVYGVMRFTKETLNNSTLSEYTRRYYYISFPYDVDLNEAFGFGQYAQHWIICEYNGSRRASEGFWADSESHWEYIWDRKGVILEKNTGYLLELELSALGESSSIWDYTNTVELYFPSQINVQTIQPHQVQVDVPSHLCTIGPRFAGGDDRRFKDSHWNLVGVPTYVNESPTGGWDETSDDYKNWVIGDQTWPAGNTWATTANYLYEYQFDDNTWQAVSSTGYVFHAMHAYLMQYAGTLVFNAANSTPSLIAARRNANYKGKYEFRLELQQNGVMADQTYISLLDVENITTGFDFNSDLSKEFNGNKPNIYTQITTVIDNEVSTTKAAGNCLPLETESVTTVPVGVRVKDAGTYTFSMPDGTEGMAVTLLDSETGVHTDLSVGDYTVELQAGSCEGRFYISIDPRNAATQIDVVGGEGDELRNAKILRNGMLFIQRGETLFDATGKRLN